VNQGHATQIGSCCKSGHIANDSAADGDDQRLAIGPVLAKGTRNVLDGAKMFRGLRIIEKMQSESMRAVQATLNGLPGGTPDFGRGNDVHAGKMPKLRDFASRMANHTHAGNNGVGTSGRLHSDACDFHCRETFPNVAHALRAPYTGPPAYPPIFLRATIFERLQCDFHLHDELPQNPSR
jgi:hypothetical protein